MVTNSPKRKRRQQHQAAAAELHEQRATANLDQVRRTVDASNAVRLYKRLLLFYDTFCRADLYELDRGELDASGRQLNSSSTAGHHLERDDDDEFAPTNSWRRRRSGLLAKLSHLLRRLRATRKSALVARLLLAHYLCCSIGMLGTIYFQYHYDYYSFHRMRLRALRTTSDAGQTRLADLYEKNGATEGRLNATIAAIRAKLKRFGSPLMSAGYLSETAYVLMMVLALFTYLSPLVYFRLRGPLDFHFSRMLLDWPREQARCRRMVRDQVNTVLASSRNFYQISQDQLLGGGCGGDYYDEPSHVSEPMSFRHALLELELGRPLSAGGSLVARLNRHHWLHDRLERLLALGRLQPIDRSEGAQILSLAQFASLLSLAVPGSCFAWNAGLFGTLPHFSGFDYELDPMDVWAFIELATLNVYLTLAGLFYISQSVVSCMGHVHVARKLKRLIDAFVVSSWAREQRLAASATHQPRVPLATAVEWRERTNLELLYILMHYKIFQAQLSASRRSSSFIAGMSICMMVSFPVLARLHLPYLGEPSAKVVATLVLVIMTFFSDMCILPVCWMNTRCLGLYGALSRLMGHLVALDHLNEGQRPAAGAGATASGPPIDSHSVWLLRKELGHPELLAERLAIATMGFTLTYAHMLRLHFWMGFVGISLYADLQSSTGGDLMLGTALSDPLGVAKNLPKY